MRTNTKLSLAAVTAASAALLSACGGSSGLIPAGSAGPLRTDFEAVTEAAENGNGNCTSTETAIARTERDFAGLPSSVDARLRTRLSEGIDHLASQARVACRQPSGGGTATTGTATESSSTSKTSSTSTSTTTTTTYTTASEEPEVPSSATSTTSSTPAGPVGGAEAPTGGAEANPGGSPAEEGEQR